MEGKGFPLLSTVITTEIRVTQKFRKRTKLKEFQVNSLFKEQVIIAVPQVWGLCSSFRLKWMEKT